MEPTGGDRSDRAKARQPDKTETALDPGHSAGFRKTWDKLARRSESMPLARGLCLTAIVLLALALWAGIWGLFTLVLARLPLV